MTDALPMLTGERATELWAKANPGLQQFPPSLYLRDFAHAAVQEYASHFAQREREAERAALQAMRKSFISIYGVEHCGDYWIENHYPSLTPQPSREITLSNGSEYRRENGRWVYLCGTKWFSDATPSCLTAADYDKCAELLRGEEQ